ncbi:PQ loop repeat-containing protein [Toxoplasma gondii TgCatPRC2]|uniref:PQ loop repeat-containing protein n=1 Tax=Toxoplasma gondii TgCatPRC2 TaxID=1130821 RepID=A0A151HDS6_TOXGO|nr:PQ loop repeat-containing protein [Toxoplasma gondii TgCatPRC2]
MNVWKSSSTTNGAVRTEMPLFRGCESLRVCSVGSLIDTLTIGRGARIDTEVSPICLKLNYRLETRWTHSVISVGVLSSLYEASSTTVPCVFPCLSLVCKIGFDAPSWNARRRNQNLPGRKHFQTMAKLSAAVPTASPAEGGGFLLVNPRCTETLLAPFQDFQCAKQVVSACLSIGILVGGSLVKLPQLVKILRAQSVAGLAEMSVFVEAISASIFVAYNVLERHPFTTWGEMLFVSLQNLCTLLLFWRFRSARDGRHSIEEEKSGQATAASTDAPFATFTLFQRVLCALAVLLLGASVACGYLVFGRDSLFSRLLATGLGLAPFPLLFCSRLPQIKQNWTQKHTGQLSAVTAGLMLCGNLARLFTSMVSLSDQFVVLSCTLATILNAIPLFQIYLYRDNTAKALGKRKEA